MATRSQDVSTGWRSLRRLIKHRTPLLSSALGLSLLSLFSQELVPQTTSSFPEPGSSSTPACPVEARTLGSTFFEASTIDLHDSDTARIVDPLVVDVSPSGDRILIGDRAEYDIKLFDRSGVLRSVIGVRGDDRGKIYSLDGAAFRGDSSIVVADAGRLQLLEFALNGTFIAETYLPVRPITSIQVVDTTTFVAGRSWPIVDANEVRGVHLVAPDGQIHARFASQPLRSVARIPRALHATAPLATRTAGDSVLVAWRLTNQASVLDLVSGTGRVFPIGHGIGFIDPDELLASIEPDQHDNVLHLSSPLVGLFSANDFVIVSYFSPGTDDNTLRHLIYRRSGEFVESASGPPLILGSYRDSLLAIGPSRVGSAGGGFSLGIFAPCSP